MVKVSKFYDKKAVLKDIYLSFFYGATIGVLGLNGAGKSSLLRIIACTDTEFNGEVVFSKGYSVGYLEQEPKLDETKTVQQIVEEAVQTQRARAIRRAGLQVHEGQHVGMDRSNARHPTGRTPQASYGEDCDHSRRFSPPGRHSATP